MAKPTVKNEIAVELNSKFPKSPTLTLARIAFKDNPTVYMSLEDARKALRYVRGESGVQNRRASKAFRENGNKKEYHIPQTWASPKNIFTIPKAYKNIGLISDIQCPFHDVAAIKIAVKYLQERSVDAILINGDFVDFYGLSSFEKDPRKRNFKSEREDCIELLRWLKNEFKRIPVYYSLDANHEYRYERYMMTKAPEIFSTDLFHLEDLLMLHDIGIIPLKGYDHILIGKLPVLHGHTIFRGTVSPVSPARTIEMKLKTSAICSHVHKVSQYQWKDLKGDTFSTWTTGCLMSIDCVEYNKHGNNYSHGFCVIKILNDKGEYMVDNKMIINGNVH